jgi:flagellar basal body-associated protein FliL
VEVVPLLLLRSLSLREPNTEEVLVLWIILIVVLIVLVVGGFAGRGRFYGRP